MVESLRFIDLVQQVKKEKFFKARPVLWSKSVWCQYSNEKCVPEGYKTAFVGYLSTKLHGITFQDSVMLISTPPGCQVSKIGNQISDEEEKDI